MEIKKLLAVIWLIWLGCTLLTAISTAIMNMKTKKYFMYRMNHMDTLKARVEEIFYSKEFQDKVKLLGLHQQPTILFEQLQDYGNCTMVTPYVLYVDTMTRSSIVKMVTDYTIYVNLQNLLEEIVTFQRVMLFIRHKSVETSLIKMLLLHECKHIEQFQNGFCEGWHTSELTLSLRGYGNKKHEKDANEFTVSCADNFYETNLFNLVKATQEATNKVAILNARVHIFRVVAILSSIIIR